MIYVHYYQATIGTGARCLFWEGAKLDGHLLKIDNQCRSNTVGVTFCNTIWADISLQRTATVLVPDLLQFCSLTLYKTDTSFR